MNLYIKRLTPIFLIFFMLWLVLKPAVASAGDIKFSVGKEGKDVYEVEKKLIRLHFNSGKVDGVFDIQTRFAVRTFQIINGLKPTGVVDEETYNRLQNPKKILMKNKYISNLIEINLTNQTLIMVRDGQIMYILPISSGRPGYDTPTGYYFVNGMWPGWHEVVNKPWTGKMYNSIYFWGSYAIHGSTSVPVFPASHGCVRITPWDADLIYPIVDRWQQIIIYR